MPTPKPRRNETLIKDLVQTHRWRRQFESDRAKSITGLAEQEGVRTPTSADSCRSPAWRPTLWKLSSMDGSRPDSGLRRCWGTGRWAGMSSGQVGILDRDLAKE